MQFQRTTDEIERSRPERASKHERDAHFYARHAALASGAKLKWTDDRRHRWPRKDRVNWVDLRLAVVEIEVSQCEDQEEKERLEQLREDYKTWMLKERDGQSWAKIAQNRIEQLGIPKYQAYLVSEAFEGVARRAHMRVEIKHPGSSYYEPEPLHLEGYCPNCGYPWL